MQTLSTDLTVQVVRELVGQRQQLLLRQGTCMGLTEMLEAARKHLAQRGRPNDAQLEQSVVVAAVVVHDYVRLTAALPEPSFSVVANSELQRH